MFHDTILDGMLGFGTLKSLDGTVMPTASGSKYRWYKLQFDIISTNDLLLKQNTLAEMFCINKIQLKSSNGAGGGARHADPS